MFDYEPRDRSGPMDLDPPAYNTSRLDAFTLPSQEDGPARKRLHSELDPSRPYTPSRAPGFAHFTDPQNTAPLLLAALNTPKRAPAYDPAQWYSSGARTPGASLLTQDVDMDSPARGGTPGAKKVEVDGEGKGGRREAEVEEVGKGKGKGSAPDKENEDKEESKPRKFARGAVTRTNRKRQQARKERGDDEEWSSVRHSDSAAPAPAFQKSEHTYNVNMNAPALRHSEIPALLLGYLQFFVNASIVLFCVYLGIQFILTVRRDVNDKIQEYSVEILQEIAECTNLYLTNMCSSNRIPHMDAPCRAWEVCMKRDPTKMGRINIIAEVFAGVINSFVEPISWKTMAFTLVTLTFLIVLTNSALFNLRARASHHDTPPTPAFWPPHGQFMPQLPHNLPHSHMLHQQHLQAGQHGSGDVPHSAGVGGEGDARQIAWTGKKEKKKGWW
ncbi:hypothetical protein IAT38_001264 [Cryptococcus sp. DSM 104549]